MKLNHLNLTVTDVAAARSHLIRYFGLRRRDDTRENPGFDLLLDDNYLVLTLIRAAVNTVVSYPATFHIGFIQESEAAVDEINRRMREDGLEVDAPQRLHGSWTFYYTAPGGFLVEVLA